MRLCPPLACLIAWSERRIIPAHVPQICRWENSKQYRRRYHFNSENEKAGCVQNLLLDHFEPSPSKQEINHLSLPLWPLPYFPTTWVHRRSQNLGNKKYNSDLHEAYPARTNNPMQAIQVFFDFYLPKNSVWVKARVILIKLKLSLPPSFYSQAFADTSCAPPQLLAMPVHQ